MYGERGISRYNRHSRDKVRRKNCNIKTRLIPVLLASGVTIFITVGCTQPEQNTWDNGSYGTGNGGTYYNNIVRETPVTVALRGEEKPTIQNTKIYKDRETNEWRVNIEWRPEYQDKGSNIDVQIKGSAPTEIIESDTITNLLLMIQGYHKYKDDNDQSVGISHNGYGWIETDDKTGELMNVLITASDVACIRSVFDKACKNNSDLFGRVRVGARADTLNGAKLIPGTKYPELPESDLGL
ncbi:MAG: hypothetical protein FWF51_06820 [Chitinivibrionia bacterium]|nr:hypothetical protein [Chitinivibrionia bacterium]